MKQQSAKKSSIIKKRYQKKIDRVSSQMNKLKNSRSIIHDRQRNIIMRKQAIINKKNQKISFQQSKQEYYAQLARENMEAKRDLVGEKGLQAKIESKIYEIRGKRYMKNSQKAKEKLAKLTTKKCELKGAKIMKMSKKVTQAIRNRIDYGTTLGPLK